ncbi:MAG: DUF4838 domain-containing protein [Armatimonadota bacterium]|jgi:hypothetical protein
MEARASGVYWTGVLGVLATLLWAGGPASGQPTITVDPQECTIVVPEAAGAEQNAAAEDLQVHIALITGVEAPIIVTPAEGLGYSFHVGIRAPDDDLPLDPEEARWTVTPEAAWLYGDDEQGRGSRFAVASFLEDQLGVRWLSPGQRGTSWAPQRQLSLTAGAFSWAPELLARGIRVDARRGRYPQPTSGIEEYWGFSRSHEEHDRYAADVLDWRVRMRMGSHSPLDYGHAFTDWWDRYGEERPDYFALTRWGHRGPEPLAEPAFDPPAFTDKERRTVKLCVSNPAVAEQIVADWVADGTRGDWVNVCMNDLRWGFCRCDGCVALDVRREGEELEDHLTDRYVHLANTVALLAREHKPEAGAVMYAYGATEQPPRQMRLEPNVVIGIVPTTVDLEELGSLYDGWAAMGAMKTFTRPNLPHYYHTMAVPIGAERQMFDVLQLAIAHGAIAADYDSLTGMWPVCGMADYVLARAMSEPGKPFEHWEQHFCAGFGAAADDVARYFRHWREDVWEARLLPDLGALIEKGKYYNFARGLMWSLGDYYTADDFDRTGAILQKAAEHRLSPAQRAQLDHLILANQHAHLTFLAVTTTGVAKLEHSRALLEFRERHRDDLQMSWISLFANETRFGDITGLRTAEALRDYPLPWFPTALAWRFKLDPDDVGPCRGSDGRLGASAHRRTQGEPLRGRAQSLR